ncbi:hypothetical protein [Clostridium sp.]|uniref:hypothetical protein n=1 Tax=Clostridium sp. TaxID=1506 RepID=UPI00262451C0|nr:hypothetical protein [Clostridium sp.]
MGIENKRKNNKKFILSIFMTLFLSVFAVHLFVESKLSKNDFRLLSIWINTILFTALITFIFIVLIIISFIRVLLKKKKYYWRLVSIIGTITVIMLISSVIITKEQKRYFHAINMNWNLDLPRNYEEIYYKDSGPSFNGDGERYSIFKYENLEEINDVIDWQDKNNSIEINMVRILKKLKVPEENYPNYNSNFKYYYCMKEDNSKIYMILDINLNKIYIVEDIF